MGILSWLLKTVVLDFLWEKGGQLLSWLFSFLKERSLRKEIEEENMGLAAEVQRIADEIKALQKAGLPVSEELKEKFREANRKLIRNSFTDAL